MIRLSNLTLQRGPQRLLEGAEMTLHAGHKAGLIGANGAGKSSLFALLRGELSPDSGDCQLPGDWRIAHMRQEVDTLDRLAVDYVLDGDVRLRKVQAELAAAEQAHDGTALARYTASEQVEIEFGFAHKERSPNVYERFPWSTWQMAALMNNFVGDGNGYVGNLDLKPEKANTLSATFDWHAADKTWGFQATPYYTRVSDYIDAVQWDATTNQAAATPVRNKFSVLRYTNQTARLFGVDLAGHAPLANNALGDWGVKGLVNVTNGKNLDTGNGLYNVMPLNGKLALTHKTGGWDNSLELVAVKAKTTVSSVRNEIRTPGYGLVNLRGSYSWNTVRLDFGIENLFDRLYFLPTGGAYVGQGTTMSNPMLPNYPQWGTAVPGMGRTLYAGVNLKF